MLFVIPETDKFAGIPVVKPFLQNDWLTLSVLLLVFITVLLLSAKRSNHRNDSIFTQAFTCDINRQSPKTWIDFAGRISLTICGTTGYALMWESTMVETPSLVSLIITFCIIILFLYLKFIVLRIFLATYSGRMPSNAVELYEDVICILGMMFIGGYFATQYSPGYFLYFSLAILGIMVAISCLIILYILFSTFFKQAGLTIEFILYLCALEIGPIAVLFKLLGTIEGLIN